MEIEEKYLDLLNLLIHDKRNKMNGIISRLEISRLISGFCISYKAYMTRQYSDRDIFIQDIEKGNVVFLLPFGVKYSVELLEEMAKEDERKIRNFFGDKFREDMIMRISEEERQEEITRWNHMTDGLENWDRRMEWKD